MKNLNRQDILNYLRQNKELLKREFGITKIALFGSYARNEADDASDIDLLIEVKMKNFQNRMLLKLYLEKEFNKKVDVSYFDSVRLFIREQIEQEIIYA